MADMLSDEELAAIRKQAEAELVQCGPHDYGLTDMSCGCTNSDPRPVISGLLCALDGLIRQRDKVLALHTEYEGRCTACVEYCNGGRDENLCTAGNVPWPCPTAAIYAEPTPEATP